MMRVLFLLFAFIALPALANEALIRQVVESKLGGVKVALRRHVAVTVAFPDVQVAQGVAVAGRHRP